GVVSVRGANVSVPGVVVTAGQVRITSAVLRSKIAQEAEIDLDQLIIDLGADVEITPGFIKMGEASVGAEGKKATVTINGRDIEVSTQSSHVTIKDGEIEVETQGVSISKGKIKVGGIEVKAPGAALSADVRAGATKVELEEEDGSVVYKVEAQKNGKFLGLFSVVLDKEIKVDAQTGATVDVKGPWWSFLASED
ncbi:MAG: hypothetical protein AABY13_05050, partial [Nanoarchaeota archaeon]